MVSRRHAEVLAWLREEPPIGQLIARFPNEWGDLKREAAKRAGAGDAAVREYVLSALQPVTQSKGHAKSAERLVTEEVRRRMLLELLRQTTLAAETGRSSGRVRFNRLNGTLLQRLFFDGPGLRRKPASMSAYRLIWPLAWQRRMLLPLVRRQGIYCFYSRAVIRSLVDVIDGRSCVEVAAGDGTLTRFLNNHGAAVRATDDFSWSAHIQFDTDVVERLDATKALRSLQPEVVICSWPPPGNRFEKRIFETASVQTYVLITSPSEADAGDWDAYRAQTSFEMVHDQHLSRLVLPSGRNLVYLFRRTTPAQAGD